MIIPGWWDRDHTHPRPLIEARVQRSGQKQAYALDFIIDTGSDRTIIGPADRYALQLAPEAFIAEATRVATAFGEVEMSFVPDCSLAFYDIQGTSHIVDNMPLYFLDETPSAPVRTFIARLSGIPYPPNRAGVYSLLGRDVLGEFCLIATQKQDFLVLTDEHLRIVDDLRRQFPPFDGWEG